MGMFIVWPCHLRQGPTTTPLEIVLSAVVVCGRRVATGPTLRSLRCASSAADALGPNGTVRPDVNLADLAAHGLDQRRRFPQARIAVPWLPIIVATFFSRATWPMNRAS